MKAHKFKIEKTLSNPPRPVKIDTAYIGMAFTIQAVYYSNASPESRVHLFDADMDECFFAVPGQMNPHILSPDVAVTVKLPLSYQDETEGNKLVIFGELRRNELQRPGGRGIV